ncbi:MAG: GGDEF domain-containing protein [Gammaproteobacteria bacterium]|nr:GGDEF domain-containing protein [Gammaproteobacteria bacterium]
MNTPNMDIEIPESVKAQILQCPTLPSLPAVVLQVIAASQDPDIGLSEVSEIIRSDPALSAKLLKVANSPLYSLRRTINNLREALTILGLNASLTIGLSFSLLNSLKNNPEQPFIHENFWKRAILSATIAKRMGKKIGLGNLEDIFLSALLQDIGILVLQCSHPTLYPETSEQYLAHDQKTLLEHETLNTNHSVVGAWILKHWNFPQKLYTAVLNSHTLDTQQHQNAKDDLFQQCISFSGHLADIWIDTDEPDLLSENMQVCKSILGLNEIEYQEFIDDICNILPEVSSLFNVQLSDNQARDRLLDQTRELILQRNLQIIKQSEQDRRQIEAMHEENKDLEEAARRDPLTGIYNRKYFEYLLDEEFENANLNRWPLSLAFIDLDNFKEVNDIYGHPAGDKVLKDIADFFNLNIRQTDTLARYGGDEFILILPGSTHETAEAMLQRLLKEQRSNHSSQIDDAIIKLGVSIGLATHIDQHDFANTSAFLKAADKALYQAKAAGRDTLVSYQD